MKKTTLICALFSLFAVAIAFGAEDTKRLPVDVQLELMTKERDDLRKQMVELKLEIMKLKEQLASGGASSASSASADAGSGEASKEWVVTISSFAKQDTHGIQVKIDEEKVVLAKLNDRIDALADSERANVSSGLYDVTTVQETDRSGFVKSRGVMTEAGVKAGKDLAETRARTNKEAIESKAKIAKLERDLQQAKVGRDIDGKLEDGSVVKISPLPSALGAADAMKVGRKYKIVGSMLKTTMISKIIMRSAVPAE